MASSSSNNNSSSSVSSSSCGGGVGGVESSLGGGGGERIKGKITREIQVQDAKSNNSNSSTTSTSSSSSSTGGPPTTTSAPPTNITNKGSFGEGPNSVPPSNSLPPKNIPMKGNLPKNTRSFSRGGGQRPAYRTSSWTHPPNQYQQQNRGGDRISSSAPSGGGVLASRSMSMGSFHPQGQQGPPWHPPPPYPPPRHHQGQGGGGPPLPFSLAHQQDSPHSRYNLNLPPPPNTFGIGRSGSSGRQNQSGAVTPPFPAAPATTPTGQIPLNWYYAPGGQTTATGRGIAPVIPGGLHATIAALGLEHGPPPGPGPHQHLSPFDLDLDGLRSILPPASVTASTSCEELRNIVIAMISQAAAATPSAGSGSTSSNIPMISEIFQGSSYKESAVLCGGGSTDKMMGMGGGDSSNNSGSTTMTTTTNNAGEVFRELHDPSVTHNLCKVCCKINARLCNGCRHVAYCSDKCQLLDWPRHKVACDPQVWLNKEFVLDTMRKELEDDETTISDHDHNLNCQHFLAAKTRKNTSGPSRKFTKTVVLPNGVGKRESPGGNYPFFLPVPQESWTQPEGAWDGKMIARRVLNACDLVASVPATMVCYKASTRTPPDSIGCLTCIRYYQASTGYRCAVCEWPVCSVECEKNELHVKFECRVFSSRGIHPPQIRDFTRFYTDSILIIRCLLLKSVNPSKYKELIDLMDVCKNMRKKQDAIDEDVKIISFLQEECNIGEFNDEMGTEELLAFIDVIDACTLELEDNRIFCHSEKSHCMPKFVFPSKLYVTQDCVPNSKWSLKHSPNLEDCSLRIHAATRLTPYQHVTTSFDTNRHVIGSWFQPYFNTSKFVDRCRCRRCQDPCELGSFFSAMRCHSCKHPEYGYLIPKNPQLQNTDWACCNQECKFVQRGMKIRRKILDWNSTIESEAFSTDFYRLVHIKCELGKELHPNHFLLLKLCTMCAKLFWGSVRGQAFFSPRYDFFSFTINLANEALRIYEFVCPGMSLERALIIFELQVACGYKLLRDIRRHMEWGVSTAQASKHHLTPGSPKDFWELIEVQEEAYNILNTEPSGTLEHEMAVVLKEIIEDQRDLLSNTLRDANMDVPTVFNLHKIYTRFSNAYYYPAVPIYEDRDIIDFIVATGPCAKYLVEPLNFPIYG